MTRAKGGVGRPEGGAGGRPLAAGGGGAHLGRPRRAPARPRARSAGSGRNRTVAVSVRPWTPTTCPNLSTGVRWFLHEVTARVSLLNAFVKN